MGFDHDAGTSVSCLSRVNSQLLDDSCIQRDTFWPAVHDTLEVVAQDQRVLPEGQPASHDQGHAAMLTCLRQMEETLVPVM